MIINITGCEILRQVLPSLKQFEAVSIRKQEIEELMKTTRGKLYPTITLLISLLKPYFKEKIKEKEIDFIRIKEEIIKNKIIPMNIINELNIEDIEALLNIEKISEEEKNRLKELGLIKILEIIKKNLNIEFKK